MKIGLVLPSAPAYSETFFTSKIKGLEANGYTIVLFVNTIKKDTLLTTTIKVAPKLSGNIFKKTVISFWSFLKSVLFNFAAAKKLYQLDSHDKLPFGRKIKNIIINSHILTEKLDWLHFGFGTMVNISLRGGSWVKPALNFGALFTSNQKFQIRGL